MENITLNSKKFLGRKQVILDCKFNVDTSKEIDKILSVHSIPIIINNTCTSGRVNYGGKLDTNLLYTTTSGEKYSLITVSDFSESFESSEIDDTSIAILDCKIVDITTPSIKANEVKVACIIDINISMVSQKQIQCANCENLVTKRHNVDVTNHLCKIIDNFEIAEEIKIKDSLNQIFKMDLNLCTKDTYCGNGFIVVEADAFLCITYEDEQGELKFHKSNFPIKQEIECENCTTDCTPMIKLSSLCYLSKTVVIQEKDSNLVKYSVPVQVCGNVYISTSIDCVQDAYSIQNITNCKFSECETLEACTSAFFEDTAKGSIQVSNEQSELKLLSFLNTNCEVTNHFMQDDKMNIEGIISTTILYSSIDEQTQEQKMTPIIAEFGFNSTYTIQKFQNCTDFQIHCSVSDIDIKSNENEFEIIAKLRFNVCGTAQRNIKLLDNVETINQRPKPDCAMEIFFSEKDQNLWEFAKYIGMTRQDLTLQNPNLQEDISKGEKIIVYHNL